MMAPKMNMQGEEVKAHNRRVATVMGAAPALSI